MSDVTLAPELVKQLYPKEQFQKLLNQQKREDGRSFNAIRETHLSLEKMPLTTAQASSLVRMGKTTVMIGIQLVVGTPVPGTVKEGDLEVQVLFQPLCSNKFMIGRPSDEAQSLGNYLTTLLKDSRMIDFEELCIEEGKSAWKLCIDAVCLDYAGNVADAALLGICSALSKLEFPAVQIDDEHLVSIVEEGQKTSLELAHIPIACTFAIYRDELVLADPTAEEEEFATGRVTIVYTSKGMLCSVYKPGGEIISAETLNKCMKRAKVRSAEALKVLQLQD